MPVPWVLMELAMCRMLMVFKCLLLDVRSTNIYTKQNTQIKIKFQKHKDSKIEILKSNYSKDIKYNYNNWRHHTYIPNTQYWDTNTPTHTHYHFSVWCDTCLVVEVVTISRHKHVDMSHDLQHIQSLATHMNRHVSYVKRHPYTAWLYGCVQTYCIVSFNSAPPLRMGMWW